MYSFPDVIIPWCFYLCRKLELKKYIYQIQILFEIRSTSASAIHNVLQRILSSFMLQIWHFLPFAGSISQVCSKMTLVRVCVFIWKQRTIVQPVDSEMALLIVNFNISLSSRLHDRYTWNKSSDTYCLPTHVMLKMWTHEKQHVFKLVLHETIPSQLAS